ncbi:hypothetical protein RJ641_015213 [Dillenia turbinata]|uniref:Uncharacterized protein n=1 Tax=Dillenia turbinata TaxID=194707 RepID=A0AAN8UUC1_9MAGN
MWATDLQSYLSDLNIFLARESNKIYILVDNRPWLRELGARPAHLWQLMVTKSRLSPFANTKMQRDRKQREEKAKDKFKPAAHRTKNVEAWFSLIDAATLSRKKDLLAVKKLRNSLLLHSELHRTLYGFIVFEVAWANVRGINYLNELQTDTSLAIEAKFMKRWEFDSIAQAASCISSWLLGTHHEQALLKEYLDSAQGEDEEVFYDAEKDFLPNDITDDEEFTRSDNLCSESGSSSGHDNQFDVYPVNIDCRISEEHTPPPPSGPYKRRKVIKSIGSGDEVGIYSEKTPCDSVDVSYSHNAEAAIESTEYRDVLILFKFNDRNLPFKLRDIIMSDLHLLTLLESGLPSWVIFLQSYPVFCHLYRPWMCPLARTLYVLISVVTVLIGFYDLYKNVPVLKATASRLCGPLFDWIETWEMASRIQYLGTMLFLHNFEKAVKWFLAITRTIRSFISVFTQPMAEPLMEFLEFFIPFWNLCVQVLVSLFSLIWSAIGFSFDLLEDFVEFLLLPFWWIMLLTWNIATSIIYPVFWALWEILYAPVRVVLGLANLVAFIWNCMYDLLGEIWLSLSGLVQLSASSATVSTYEVSMWRSLWNDLFSQVFRAVRSILNGFVAFFSACNRHRLSIYNHFLEFIQRLSGQRRQRVSSGDSHWTYGTQNYPEVWREVRINSRPSPARK